MENTPNNNTQEAASLHALCSGARQEPGVNSTSDAAGGREREDTARLDWLEKLANVKIWEAQHGRWHVHLDRDERTRMPITGDTIRAAIDAAMKAACGRVRGSEPGRPLAEDSARTQRLDTPTPALRRSPLADSIADRLRENRERRTKEGKRPTGPDKRPGGSHAATE